MEGWQGVRLQRALDQNIPATRVDCTDDSLFFSVKGVSGDYMVEVHQNVNLWPPRCDCEDNC